MPSPPAWCATSVVSPQLAWRGAMASTSPIVSSCGCPGLVTEPHALRDSWSKTFYTPLLVKQDAAALLASVPADEEATLDVDVSLTCTAQFGGRVCALRRGCVHQSWPRVCRRRAARIGGCHKRRLQRLVDAGVAL